MEVETARAVGVVVEEQGGHMVEKSANEIVKQAGVVLLVVYIVGFGITNLLLIIMSRVQCVQNLGWAGLFWCPDSLIVAMYTGFFKALLWPYLLYNWLFA